MYGCNCYAVDKCVICITTNTVNIGSSVVSLIFAVDDGDDFWSLIILKRRVWRGNQNIMIYAAEGLSLIFPNTCIPAKQTGDHFPTRPFFTKEKRFCLLFGSGSILFLIFYAWICCSFSFGHCILCTHPIYD